MIDAQGMKYLPVERLIELLSELPPGSRLTPNAIGNLLVTSSGGERNLGAIDFAGAGSFFSFN